MVLLSAGQYDSCRWNAVELLRRLEFEQSKSVNITKYMAYQFVNISLIYVKCLLIESKEEAIKNQSGLVLDKAYNLLIKWFGHQDQYFENIQNIKDHIYQKNYQK